MDTYIDGFAFPIATQNIDTYKKVAAKVAEIWKEYGALSYQEFVGDDMHLEGVKSFLPALEAKENETVVFGWVLFPSKQVRDDANAKVPQDVRMSELVGPLLHPDSTVFDASRMIYGGFKALVHSGS